MQLPQVDVFHGRLEGAQTVAELVLAGVAEAEVPDVAQVGHPDDNKQTNNNTTQLNSNTENRWFVSRQITNTQSGNNKQRASFSWSVIYANGKLLDGYRCATYRI